MAIDNRHAVPCLNNDREQVVRIGTVLQHFGDASASLRERVDEYDA
ncbi:hypothetical protein [Singulisphaera sp. GP187]|nr:hypothetical protein [Singulisphaera sp. GP187]